MKHNTVCHIEIEVTDLKRSQAFYQGLFGWHFSEFAMPDMVVFGQEEEHIGGLMRVDRVEPSRSPSVWYRVADLDKSIDTACGLGGSIEEEKGEVASVGWSAVVRDPDGNRVGMVMYAEDAR
ncbi:MAG: VOC family protein [Fimbriimonadaceae bacterium]|nr:VOC family protein [Fimbriimonadaceae bacterium]QYK55985.1 MAG: VOC family protein [Fimbriimonadaceae bacterium]